MPGRTRQRPTHLKAETPQALARRAAKEAEQARTFAGVAPGAELPQFGQRQQVLARARLSPAYARALRVVAWKLGRRSGRVPLNPQTLAIVEALAARYRAKEEAARTYPAPNAAQRIKRAVRAVAREPGVIVHRRQWDIRSKRKDAADRRAMAARLASPPFIVFTDFTGGMGVYISAA